MRLIRFLILLLLPVFLIAQNEPVIEVGSFNIEWFPCKEDGQMMQKYGINLRNPPRGNPTDVPALFQLLKELDIELLGVVEIVDTDLFARKAKEYLGPQYEFVYAPSKSSQKVGFLYDSSVLELKEAPQVYMDVALNPDSWLRPALRGYFKYKPAGFDFHAIIVHLKAAPSGWKIRKKQWQALEKIITDLKENSGDKDIILMGDFNNVSRLGYKEFLPRIDKWNFYWATHELLEDSLVTNYWQPDYTKQYIQGSLIDQIFISDDAKFEMVPNSVKVGGVCAEGRKSYEGPHLPEFYEKISDHCPVFVSFKADIDND
ncbi:endonuclease/exonuclease/phosphatase family protein [Caldithrix abyssi]